MGFRHVVMFRWTEESTPEQRAAFVEALRGLAVDFAHLGRLQIGTDAGLAEGNFDCVLVGDFASREDYLTYAADPGHQEVIVRVLRPIIGQRSAVQHDT